MPPKKSSSTAITKKAAVAEHPAYKDMIKEAILTLKERNGSSRQALKKYIQNNFKVKAAIFETQFNAALKRGVSAGDFVQPKGPSGTVKLQKKEPAPKPKEKKPAAATKKAVTKKAAAPKKTATIKKEKSASAKKTTASKTKKPASTKAAKSKALKAKPAARVTKKAAPKKAAPKKAASTSAKKA
ncbi:winged helix-turn-helix transcription repressor DNA-binding protein [Lipomyces oligophaga]|uniref:winged helix-turn-helix transcription repressor DNA-binding protein n=1 Tax=Lipomyces oligophaga TaxID=45792 RepID=UPI0034CE6A24